MILPSKELLSEVLDCKIEEISINDNMLNYKYSYIDYQHDIKVQEIEEDCINIYELAYKCKEWARDNYYVNIMTYKKGVKYYVLENEFLNDEIFESDTEIEVIFKACEWVRTQIAS